MITVRNASREDKQAIAEFQIAMALETENLQLDAAVVDQGVEAVFNDASKGSYYVATEGHKVIGSLLTTYEWSDWRNGQILWIQSVFVLKDYRGKGVFKKLYTFVKNKVEDKTNNLRGIRLYVDKSNGAAQRVYEKLGMENHHYETYEWMVDY